MWKDMLMVLFNLIDYNHSGTVKFVNINRWKSDLFLGFISRNEFADVIKIILNDEKGAGKVDEEYIEELASAMDFDKNGKIDVNEFLGNTKI